MVLVFKINYFKVKSRLFAKTSCFSYILTFAFKQEEPMPYSDFITGVSKV